MSVRGRTCIRVARRHRARSGSAASAARHRSTVAAETSGDIRSACNGETWFVRGHEMPGTPAKIAKRRTKRARFHGSRAWTHLRSSKRPSAVRERRRVRGGRRALNAASRLSVDRRRSTAETGGCVRRRPPARRACSTAGSIPGIKSERAIEAEEAAPQRPEREINETIIDRLAAAGNRCAAERRAALQPRARAPRSSSPWAGALLWRAELDAAASRPPDRRLPAGTASRRDRGARHRARGGSAAERRPGEQPAAMVVALASFVLLFSAAASLDHDEIERGVGRNEIEANPISAYLFETTDSPRGCGSTRSRRSSAWRS